MSGGLLSGGTAGAASAGREAAPTVLVRAAVSADAPEAAACVTALLRELGAQPPSLRELEETALGVIEDERQGVVLLAGDADGRVVGLLGASWQVALRTCGAYGLIQELWVAPDRRGESIGAALLGALLERAAERGLSRIEVGLPGARFAGLEATGAFYASNGFAPIGSRMRRLL